MRTTDILTRLYDHHARILAQIDASTALLRQDPLIARAPLAKTRLAMTRMLRKYQLFKHREIFAPAIAGADELRAADARCLRAACIAAGDDFAAYVARWSTADVAAQWNLYVPAMRRMSGQLQAHIGRERWRLERLLTTSPSARAFATPVGRDAVVDRSRRASLPK